MLKVIYCLLVILLLVTYMGGEVLAHELVKYKLHETHDKAIIWSHFFQNGNIISLYKDGTVTFGRDKVLIEKAGVFKYFAQKCFFIRNNLGFYFDENHRLWIITDEGKVVTFINDLSLLLRSEIQGSITPINYDHVVYIDVKSIKMYNWRKNELVWTQTDQIFNEAGQPFIVTDNMLINSNGVHIFALDLKTGKLLWSKKINRTIDSSIFQNYPDFITEMELVDNMLVFSTEKYVYNFDIFRKKILWRRKKPKMQPSDGFIYRNLYILKLSSDLHAYDINSGKEVWRSSNNLLGDTYLYKNMIFCHSSTNGELKFIEASTGNTVYSSQNEVLYGYHTFEIADNGLYMTNEKGVYQVIIDEDIILSSKD